MHLLLELKFSFHRSGLTTQTKAEVEGAGRERWQDETVKGNGCSINNRDTAAKIRAITVFIVKRKIRWQERRRVGGGGEV